MPRLAASVPTWPRVDTSTSWLGSVPSRITATGVAASGTVEEIDLAFATLVRQAVGALVVGQDAFFLARREQVAALGRAADADALARA